MSVLSESLRLHKTARKHYQSLAKGAECQVTYVWIDQAGESLQCKTRTLDKEPTGLGGGVFEVLVVILKQLWVALLMSITTLEYCARCVAVSGMSSLLTCFELFYHHIR